MSITKCINYKIHNFGFDMQVGQFGGSSGQISGNTQKPSIIFYLFVCDIKPSQNEEKFTKFILHCSNCRFCSWTSYESSKKLLKTNQEKSLKQK